MEPTQRANPGLLVYRFVDRKQQPVGPHVQLDLIEQLKRTHSQLAFQPDTLQWQPAQTVFHTLHRGHPALVVGEAAKRLQGQLARLTRKLIDSRAFGEPLPTGCTLEDLSPTQPDVPIRFKSQRTEVCFENIRAYVTQRFAESLVRKNARKHPLAPAVQYITCEVTPDHQPRWSWYEPQPFGERAIEDEAQRLKSDFQTFKTMYRFLKTSER